MLYNHRLLPAITQDAILGRLFPLTAIAHTNEFGLAEPDTHTKLAAYGSMTSVDEAVWPEDPGGGIDPATLIL